MSTPNTAPEAGMREGFNTGPSRFCFSLSIAAQAQLVLAVLNTLGAWDRSSREVYDMVLRKFAESADVMPRSERDGPWGRHRVGVGAHFCTVMI